jgi:hypothetical protein
MVQIVHAFIHEAGDHQRDASHQIPAQAIAWHRIILHVGDFVDEAAETIQRQHGDHRQRGGAKSYLQRVRPPLPDGLNECFRFIFCFRVTLSYKQILIMGVTAALLLAFCARHGISPLVEVLPMAEINTAVARLRQGDVRYRFVLQGPA